MSPRAGQDAVVKRKVRNPCRESNPVRPARCLVTIRDKSNNGLICTVYVDNETRMKCSK
jgi:hypothetical protein